MPCWWSPRTRPVSYTHLTQYKKACGACLSAKPEKCWKINKYAKEVGFLDIRIEKTERAIKQAFMELRREKPVSYTHLDVYKRQEC